MLHLYMTESPEKLYPGRREEQYTFIPEDGTENEVVNLYPDVTFQTMEGFGGAVTDAAGYVFSLMDKDQQKEMLDMYFGEEGMHYDRVRLHMDSCDFSTRLYSAVEDEEDEDLDTFSFAHTEKYMIPLLGAAQQRAGKKLKVMLSAWSPPEFMKTNGSRIGGGSLKKEYYERWARYLCRYIEEFEKRGYEVERMSLQNEPAAVQTWDSCVYTVEEEKEFLRDHLYPEMKKRGLEHVEIFGWDHNKERLFERARGLIDARTDSMIAGLAFHWYSGDHFEALDLVREKFPGKQLLLSESCLEYTKFDKNMAGRQGFRLAHEVIGDLNHGMTAFHDWNILLDEEGGPNHVGNFCHAPFLYDRKTKKLMRQTTQTFFYMFSHYIVPGSVRIAFSKYTGDIEMSAYKTPQGEIIVILLNCTEKDYPVNFRLNGKVVKVISRAGSIAAAELM